MSPEEGRCKFAPSTQAYIFLLFLNLDQISCHFFKLLGSLIALVLLSWQDAKAPDFCDPNFQNALSHLVAVQ